MAYRAVEIANEFLGKPEAAGSLTQMQLQKLAYLANGWNLAINGEPLVAETPEAWDFGPVYRDLYEHTKYFGKAPLERLISPDDSFATRVLGYRGDHARLEPAYMAWLAPQESAVVDHVWKRYGKLTGPQLSALTHQSGTPWHQTYSVLGRSKPIDQNLIKRHFDELAERAQRAAA